MNEENVFRMTGGEAMAEMLRLYEAPYVFGIAGFQLLPFYDAVCRAGNRQPRHILVNDERTGAFAADGYARLAGKIGFCDGTLGPGATNLTTALVEAATAGIPLVAFIGDSNRDHSGKNMTQETKQAEILAPSPRSSSGSNEGTASRTHAQGLRRGHVGTAGSRRP